MIENEMLIDKFLYQKDLTKKDIIDENIMNIYLVSNGAFLFTWLLSQNSFDFLKNFLIITLIGITSFDINLRYFSSEKHKKQLEDNIKLLKNAIEINKYDITTFNKFRELYIKELSFEAQKLVEITKK